MNAKTLTVTAIGGLPTVQNGDDLARLVLTGLRSNGTSAQDGDLLVLAQKIVSKAEGRIVLLSSVTPSSRAFKLAETTEKDPRLVELILRESVEVLRTAPGVMIVEDRRGFVMANAGIDSSNVESVNADEAVLLLPENPDASAERIRTRINELCGVSVGVIINDSFGRAWRLGTTGTAIGVAGIPALLDLRGNSDRNGRPLQSSDLGVADEVASAASLVMGQADEGRPVVLVRGFPYPLAEGRARDLVRPTNMDLFR